MVSVFKGGNRVSVMEGDLTYTIYHNEDSGTVNIVRARNGKENYLVIPVRFAKPLADELFKAASTNVRRVKDA
jgi:hypothetical protein